MSDIRKRSGVKGTTYQVRYPDKSTKTGYAYKTFWTLKEARAFREDAYSRSSVTTARSNIRTVEEAVSKWLKICEKEGLNGREPVTAYTLKNYLYRSSKITDYEWRKPLHELQAPDIVEFRSWLLSNGCSRDLARKTLVTLQSVLKEMTLRGHLPVNVASGIGVRSESRYDAEIQIPNTQELLSILRAADKLSNSKNVHTARSWRRFRPILYLAADSGMRPQEYLGASIRDLHETGIEITQAITGDGRKISVPKTPASRRFIELSKSTIKMIRHFIDEVETPNPHGLIFPCANGKWQCRKNWQQRGFNVACIEAGLAYEEVVGNEVRLKPKYRPYDLRHFYASVLFDKKVNLKKIQTLMGHTKIETTLNIYGHLLDDPALKAERHGILGDLL